MSTVACFPLVKVLCLLTSCLVYPRHKSDSIIVQVISITINYLLFYHIFLILSTIETKFL